MLLHVGVKVGCRFGNNILRQWFSKCGPQTTRVQDSFKGSAKSKLFTFLTFTTKTLFTFFHYVDTYMMVKKQWWIKLWGLCTIKGVAPKCTKSHCVLHRHFT